MCFQNFGVWKKLIINGGFHDFASKKKYSYSTKLIGVGTFCASENFWHWKVFWIRWGHISFFHREFFCLTSTKNVVGEHFCVSELFWLQTIFWIKGVSRLCRILLSHSTKKLVVEPFCASENFWYGTKVKNRRGAKTFFRRNFFVSQCRNRSCVNPSVFPKVWVFETFLQKRGV